MYVEASFAEGIVPQWLPKLVEIKPQVECSSSTDATLNAKEALIDTLISTRSIKSFSPFNGPVDPFVKALERTLFYKLNSMDKQSKTSEAVPQNSRHNILQFFFGPCFTDECGYCNRLGKEILQKFPLFKAPAPKEKLVAKQVIQKRFSNSDPETESIKKPVLTLSASHEKTVVKLPIKLDDLVLS